MVVSVTVLGRLDDGSCQETVTATIVKLGLCAPPMGLGHGAVVVIAHRVIATLRVKLTPHWVNVAPPV
jgi:hypothetical protein